MDNKCFITKYQSSVENDNLPYYGAIVMHCPKLPDGTTDIMTNRAISIVISEKVEGQRAVIVKGSHFTNYDNTEDKGKTIEFVVGNNTFYTPNEDTDIVLYNCKYGKNIYKISLNDFMHGPNRSIAYFDISELKYLTNLQILSIFAYDLAVIGQRNKIYGDISSLSNLMKLEQLAINNSSVAGDISSLSNLTMLKKLDLGLTYVTGDITDIVNNCTKLVNLSIPAAVTITDEQKKTLTDRGCTVIIR